MFEATSWVTSASRDDDGTSDVDRMNAERLLSTNYCRSAVRCVENPVVNTTVRKTGDFGRQLRNRRKIPSPAPIGDYRVFSDTS